MSYDPKPTKSAMYSAYLSSSPFSLSTQTNGGYYEFGWDTSNGACEIISLQVHADHGHSFATCDISTSSGNLSIWNYGFTNGTYRTASHIRNEYSKGDDCAVGVHVRQTLIKVDTGVLFYGSGSRNISNLDQLVGVII